VAALASIEACFQNHWGGMATALAAGDKEAALADFKAAEAEARKAIELDSSLGWGRLNLGFSLREQYVILGSSDRGLLERAVAEYTRVVSNWRASGGDPGEEVHPKALANLCDALLLAGDPGRALETCRAAADARPDDPLNHYNLAGACALAGRKDEALKALERDVVLGDRDVGYLSSDRWFESLHGDPRFDALLRKMKEAASRQRP